MNARHFSVGDRVERILAKQKEPRGTVVGIVQDEPQIVAVSWDGPSPPRQITQELSERLILIP